MKTVVWVVFALLLLTTSASSLSAAEEWTRTYRFPGRPEVRVVTDDGSVTVKPWDRRDVEVRIKTLGFRIGQSLKIVDRQDGDELEIEARTPRNSISFNWSSRWVRITMRVPRELDLEIESGDGAIDASDLSGRVRIHTGDGGIRLAGLRGELELSTGDGRIEASGLDGTLDATTGDGAVDVAGRFDALDLETGDGHIVVEAEPKSRLGRGWNFHSGDGPITLRIPSDLEADLDVHAGDGSIRVDLPVQVSGPKQRRALRGTLNGGGPPLRVRAGDGAVRIEGL